MQNMEFDENGNRKMDQHQAFLNPVGDIQERLAQINLNEYREKPTRHVFKDSAFDSRETGSRINELLFDRNRPIHITDEDPIEAMMRNYRENYGGNQRW